MDSLTHIALGALIGETLAGKKLGKRAMLIGAAAQSLPDIDFIESFWLTSAHNLVAHRGITHSIIFSVFIISILSITFARSKRTPTLSPIHWAIFFTIEIFTHLFLDAFNNYGVGWFEPFSHQRISFNTIFVADPFFSIAPGIALIVLLILRQNNRSRKYWASIPLIVCAAYLCISGFNKWRVNVKVSEQIIKQHIPSKRFFTTPTAFNNLLWYIVIEVDKGYYIGYRSVFDKNDTILFQHVERKKELLSSIKHNEEIEYLLRFSEGYYTVEKIEDGLIFNDLRFGQIMGWNNPVAPFVFHYYLERPEKNLLVIQRGRFQGWDKRNAESLITRIRGIN